MMTPIGAFRNFANAPNKTADDVSRDVVHKLYHGVLCCKNTVRFHGTPINVISFTPVRKIRPSLSQFFHETRKLRANPYIEFHQNRARSVESMARPIFTKPTDIPLSSCAHVLYRTLSKSGVKCRKKKNGQNLIYARK
jgi:hypothetical protein